MDDDAPSVPVRRRISGEPPEWNPQQSDREEKRSNIYQNFCWYSILFGANHATGLGTHRIIWCRPQCSSHTMQHHSMLAVGHGTAGVQCGVPPNVTIVRTQCNSFLHSNTSNNPRYLSYTASACLGATVLVHGAGAKQATVIGMGLFCCYVGCFVIALLWSSSSSFVVIYLGASLGGVGAGVAWTAQGVFFAETAFALSNVHATSQLASVFACSILVQETVLEALSTVVGERWDWWILFGLYFGVAVMSTIAMQCCVRPSSSSAVKAQPRNKLLAALTLLRDDPSMKYMIAFHIAYGLAGAFLNSFINGEVVVAVLQDDSYVGILTALHGIVAAIAAACFGTCFTHHKVRILMLGSMCFALVALPTLIWPDFHSWNPTVLVAVYALQGIGRATSEGTLKALFVELFAYEKEGAFANIILQYGLASSFAYLLSNNLSCSSRQSVYCILYRDGSHHDMLVLSLVVVLFGILSIASLALVRSTPMKHSSAVDGVVRRNSSLEMLTISRTLGEYQTIQLNEQAVAAS